MSASEANRPRQLLLLGAHSDDIEIGCGGTILQMLESNPHVDIDWVVCSGNEARIDEAKQSCELMTSRSTGVVRFHQLGFRDSYFPAQWEAIKERLHDLAKTVTPDLIWTHRRDDAHQDHRVIAELTQCAFRQQQIFEYEIPKFDGDLGQPNIFVPVSAEAASRKCDILLDCFASQQTKPWFTEETFRALLRIRGLEANSPSGLAEGFHGHKIVLSADAISADSFAPASSQIKPNTTPAELINASCC